MNRFNLMPMNSYNLFKIIFQCIKKKSWLCQYWWYSLYDLELLKFNFKIHYSTLNVNISRRVWMAVILILKMKMMFKIWWPVFISIDWHVIYSGCNWKGLRILVFCFKWFWNIVNMPLLRSVSCMRSSRYTDIVK